MKLAAGFMAEAASPHHRQAGRLHRHAGPRHCQCGAAPCSARWSRTRRSSFSSGQRARVTEQRVRRGRIQFVKQDAAVRELGEVQPRRSNTPTRPTRSFARRSASRHVRHARARRTSNIRRTSFRKSSMCPSRCRRRAIAWSSQGADVDMVAEAAEADPQSAKNPILLVGHAVHTSRSGARSRSWPNS